ncbi:MAG: purine-binding chemotaxis protein CheW [Desulfobacterales bacterium]|nr:purine-binding chemotaxis protein CheW [Desulfobacterales bacterium]MBF0397341.1 purine-binding chemotaxis protein CheW [Desulfobacterales bacterium]
MKEENNFTYEEEDFDDMAQVDGDQYVTFSIADEEYGIEILQVQEIISYKGFTKIPNLSSYIKGVLNLRGAAVPAIDMRAKFNLTEKTYDKYTVIIITVVKGKTMGMVVDAISDVVIFNKNDIKPAPDFSSKIKSKFIKGMGNRDKKFIILLDIDKILSDEEIAEVESLKD